MTDWQGLDLEHQDDTLKNRFITFLMGNETFGIEIRYVTEIIGIQESTEVPQSPAYIKGIINLRGIIIPIMDVRLRFSMEQKEYTDRTCIIVANFDGRSVGLIVDSVSEVVALENENILEIESTIGINNRYVKNVGKIGDSIILLLDCESLFGGEESEAV